MPITREKAIQFIESGRAQGISDEELQAEIQRRQTADPGTAALRKATGISVLTPEQELRTDIEQAARQIGAPLAEIGLPLATAFLTKGTGTLAAAGLQAGAAGLGNLLGQVARRPGQPAELSGAILPTALAGLGTLATAGTGTLLTRAGGAGQEAVRQVTRRGVVGGAELAFRFDVNAEERALETIRQFVQRPPLSGGRVVEEAILQQAAQRGDRIPVIPTVDRLANALGVQPREAFLSPPSETVVSRPSTILQESGRPFQIQAVEKVPRQQGIKAVGEPKAVAAEKLSAQARADVLAKRLLAEADDAGTISIKRFEEILRKEISKPTIRVKGRIEPSLQESEYIQALGRVKTETVEELASTLGSDKARFLRARVAARREITALENLRRKLFFRDRAGNLQAKESALPTIQNIFRRAEAGNRTLLKLFEEFDAVSGTRTVPFLRELASRRELSGGDKATLVVVDGVVRSMAGLRSGAAELASASARGVGKMLQIGARPAGALGGIAGQLIVGRTFEEGP